ncbi:unnamed protein product [Cylindrotheca closterium]|uniref:Uncharacterized protein n=1 Tax=Cylindrotheca closterium TaxID=2856 RepID=A0AAD2GC29_9STRA|nr:unnamed protein product [Cylindrotheca closterium]
MFTVIYANQAHHNEPDIEQLPSSSPQTSTEFQEVPITKDESPHKSENSMSTASLTAMSNPSMAEEDVSWATLQVVGDDSSENDDGDSDDEDLDVQELLDMYDTIDTIQVGRELAETPSKIIKRPSSYNLKGEEKEVRFSTVQVREYPIVPGDNPSGDSGPPITIGWKPTREMEVSVDHNEQYGLYADEKALQNSDHSRIKRNVEGLHLSHLKRMCKLHHSGYSSKEIGAATKAADDERRKREETLKSLKNEKLNEYKETIKRAFRNATVARKAKKAEKEFLKPYIERSSKNRHSSIVNESGELPNAKTYEDDGGFWYY